MKRFFRKEKTGAFTSFLLLVFLCFLSGNLSAQTDCTNDQEPPVARCKNHVAVHIDYDIGVQSIRAEEMNFTSIDSCTAAEDLKFSFSAQTSDTLRQFTRDQKGRQYPHTLYVTDERGNQDSCNAQIVVIGNIKYECDIDITPPVASYDTVDDYYARYRIPLVIWAEGSHRYSHYDYCTDNLIYRIEREEDADFLTVPDTDSLILTFADTPFVKVVYWVGDINGNWIHAKQKINVHLPTSPDPCAIIPDTIPPSIYVDDQFLILENDQPDTLIAQELRISDFCNGNGKDVFYAAFSDDRNDTSRIFRPEDVGHHQLEVFAWDTSGNVASKKFKLFVNIESECVDDTTPPELEIKPFFHLTRPPSDPDPDWYVRILENKDLIIDVKDDCSPYVDVRFQKAEEADYVNPPESHFVRYNYRENGDKEVLVWAGDTTGNWIYKIAKVKVELDVDPLNRPDIILACRNVEIEFDSTGRGRFNLWDVLPAEDSLYYTESGADFYIELSSNSFRYPRASYYEFDSMSLGNEYVVKALATYNDIPLVACWSRVELPKGDCTFDHSPPGVLCKDTVHVDLSNHSVDILEPEDVIFRAFDNCSVERIDARITGLRNFGFDEPPSENSRIWIYPRDTIGKTVEVWVPDGYGNWDACLSYVNVVALDPIHVKGKVFLDDNKNCVYDPGEQLLEGWTVTSETLGEGNKASGKSSATGQVDFYAPIGVRDSMLELSVQGPNLEYLSHRCITGFTIGLPYDRDSFVINFPIETIDTVLFQGSVYDDNNLNCNKDNGEFLPNEMDFLFRLEPSGNYFYGESDSLGHYEQEVVFMPGDTAVRFELQIPSKAGLSCFTDASWHPDSILTDTFTHHVPYQIDTLVIRGNVFWDYDEDCMRDPLEEGLSGWGVESVLKVSSNAYQTFTDSAGNYEILLLYPPSDTVFYMHLLSSLNYGSGCPLVHDRMLTGMQDTLYQDIPVRLDRLCPSMNVQVSAPFIRRCTSTVYTVNYCNYGSEVAENVELAIKFDPDQKYDGSEIQPSGLNGDTLFYQLGTVQVGECQRFWFKLFPDCDSVDLDQTLCVEAYMKPDTFCMPIDPLWSGASLKLTGNCEGDSVRFKIKNVGSSDMVQDRQYIVIEDIVVMRVGDPFSLPAGGEISETVPALGATIRVEVPQTTGHPGNSMPSITLEGCGEPPFTTGLVNQFGHDDGNAFTDIDCQAVRGSYDPNDKQAVPEGFGSSHFIEPNVDLEYMIRFQNTGRDTAFKVVIVDTLSRFLNIASVRPGASSHPYTFDIYDQNILRFTFDQIFLVDSFTNEPASNGFIKYKIEQKSDLPLGAVIKNAADIYFDFNDPVYTNQTTHTIGKNFLFVKTDEVFVPDAKVKVFPNPFTETATLKLESEVFNSEFICRIFDLTGRLVSSYESVDQSVVVSRAGMAAGFYFYEISAAAGKIAAGKIIVR